MFDWVESLGIASFVFWIRGFAQGFYSENIYHLIYSLPYGLWVLSFCSFIGLVWENDYSINAMIWRFSAPVIGIVSELMQLGGIMQGTFDVNDLLMLVILSSLGLLISLL